VQDRILDTAVAMNGAESLEEITRTVMQRVGEVMRCDRFGIALLDESSGTLEINTLPTDAATADPGGDRATRLPVDESTALGWALLNRRPHVRDSHVVVPLEGRESVLGLLEVTSRIPGAFDEADVEALCGYARLTALAIENLRNYLHTRERSIRDSLTGAYNHRHLKETLAQEIDGQARHGGACSLLLLDIDHFKQLNDTHGHQAGDQVLVRTVRVLEEALGASDMVFRYGGEEFAVVLPQASAGHAAEAAQNVLEALRSHNEYRPNQAKSYRVTASIGVATSPIDARGVEALVACADQAMYRAKASGRDRVVVFSQIEEVQQVESKLRDRKGCPDQLYLTLWEDESPGDHNRRIVEHADMLAEAIDLSARQRANLRIASLYHDIGRVGIPRDLLERPGPIDARERSLITAHPVVGESFLSRVIRIGEVLLAVLHQHERFDGTGVPSGLIGEDVPLLARILTTVKVFDALVSERSYQEPSSVERAYETLQDASGFQLDPELVDHFIAAHSHSRPTVVSD